jgi:hypothetical protein
VQAFFVSIRFSIIELREMSNSSAKPFYGNKTLPKGSQKAHFLLGAFYAFLLGLTKVLVLFLK